MSQPDIKHMIKQLIATPSISCSNLAYDQSNLDVINILAGWLENCHFNVRILPIPNNAGKANLIATLGKGSGGLVLAGHSDTVPFDVNRWQSDPFSLKESNGRYYGLGTADMKSFLAMAIEAASTYTASQLKHPLIILATADEETSMSGARALCADDLSAARYAVIGEPTGLKPVYQHKGIIMEAITLRGQSGHSSNPDLGNSALEGMHAVMAALINLRAELEQQYKNEAFSVPVPTLNLGHIHGGDNPNRICGECELHIDCRPVPGMNIDDLRASIRSRTSEVAQSLGLKVKFRQLFAGVEAFRTELDSPIIETCRNLTGADPISVNFGTEGPFYNQMGIETVVIGPGNINQAHQPDEYIDISSVQPTVDLLRHLINKFCF